MSKHLSLLKNGIIPAHEECPFKDKCPMVIDEICKHKGKEHEIDFSCATARAYDLMERVNSEESSD